MELGFGETKVGCFADHLIDGGLDEFLLFGKRWNLSAWDDESSMAPTKLDKTVSFQKLVGLAHGQRIDMQLRRKIADRGKLGIRS